MHTKVQGKGNVIAWLASLKSIHISCLAINGHLIIIPVPTRSRLVRDHVSNHGELGGGAGRLLRVVVQVQLTLRVRPGEVTHRVSHLLLLLMLQPVYQVGG
jgi:hypothetical protein